jgi:hypothetical protein
MTYPRNADIETPEADAAEQWADLSPEDAPDPPEVDIETPEADAQEQSQFVGGDDDDYR